MQTTAKATRKELKQFLTVYQSIIEFSLEKMWLEVIIKYNKKDPDEMLDDVNAQLINVCWDYLETHTNLPIDKYQLATIVMDLYTQTISTLDTPFKVIAKESKDLVKDYLEKNKKKAEALERIKKENDELDKEIAVRNEEFKQQQFQLSNVNINAEPEPVPQPTVVHKNIPISRPTINSTKTKKAKYRGTGSADLLIDDSFSLPSWR